MNYAEILEVVKAVSIEAGKKILEVYNSPDFEIEIKSDNSPVTKADKIANDYIVAELQQRYSEIGVLAEESKKDDSRLTKNHVWVIDPLDGTKEFIKRNGEFTVNVGLSENGIPRLGVVVIPVKNEVYYAAAGEGAFFQDAAGNVAKITCSQVNTFEEMTLMKSRSHASQKLNDLIAECGFKATKDSGSSIKICLIARGLAEVYFRLGPTNEWDICAAHCVLNEAGGKLTDSFGVAIEYNKKDTLNKNGFVASNASRHDDLVTVATKYINL